MSLWSRDRLHAALTPARVDVLRLSAFRRRDAVHIERTPVAGGAAQPAWRGAVEAFAQALAGIAPRGGRCSIVLSNHYCRYVLVPGDAGLANARERETYARLQFEHVYGAAVASGWDVRVGEGPAGAARLACAVDRALVDELERACGAATVAVASVTPMLCAAFDRHRARFTSHRFWFAAAEEGRLCLAAVENRQWRSIASQRTTGDPGEELGAMLERALWSVPGATKEAVYVHAAETARGRMRALEGVTLLEAPPRRAPGKVGTHAWERVFA